MPTDTYDPDDVTIIVDGTRVEQLQEADLPEVEYEREYEETIGDDDNILLQDHDPDLEGDIEVAPTSGTIPTLDDLVESGEQVSVTAKFPADHARDTKTYVGASFTASDSDAFDGEDAQNIEYTFIADNVE